MKITTIIARSLLGLIFVVFGLNMFLNFIPMPPPPEGPAREFMTALFMSHYVYVVGALQVAGGLILLSGRCVPLGLTLLGPVILNIDCFHGAIINLKFVTLLEQQSEGECVAVLANNQRTSITRSRQVIKQRLKL
jgi:hypothetical protein